MIRKATQALARLALPLAMQKVETRYRQPLIALAQDPERVQAQTLERILQQNANTAFGRQHGFNAISDWRSYGEAVPVQTYESLRGFIDQQASSGRRLLTQAQPLGYARTSGTTGRPKDVPVTAEVQRHNCEAQRLMALTLQRQTSFFRGEILSLTGAAVEGQRAGGCYGSATGQAQRSLSCLVKALFLLPEAVSSVPDYETRYYLATLLGLASPRLTGLVAANPSTCFKLVETAESNRDRLMADLVSGSSDILDQLDPRLAYLVRQRLRQGAGPSPRLRRLLAGAQPLQLGSLWPDLGALATWTGGSCGVALEALCPELPEGCRVVEIGYRASEVIATVNLDCLTNSCLPTLHQSVFEFVEREDWEAGRPAFLSLAELEANRDYYIFVTTAAGLYRYDMNDLVRVSGWIGRTPTLTFLRKGRGMTNITGEKLAEEDLIAAVTGRLAACERRAPFFLALADQDERRYELLLELEGAISAAAEERICHEIDQALRALNLEYEAKRASGRLLPLRLVLLRPGAGEHCKRQAVIQGQREAQFKPVCLAHKSDWQVDLTAFGKVETVQ